MPEQIRKNGQRDVSHDTEQREQSPLAGKANKIKAEMDALLDEIDGVLEQNAAEFVAGYVQQGGQ